MRRSQRSQRTCCIFAELNRKTRYPELLEGTNKQILHITEGKPYYIAFFFFLNKPGIREKASNEDTDTDFFLQN